MRLWWVAVSVYDGDYNVYENERRDGVDRYAVTAMYGCFYHIQIPNVTKHVCICAANNANYGFVLRLKET